jgi:hypothetical protein
MDVFEKQLGIEGTGGSAVIFEGSNVQLQVLSQQRQAFSLKKGENTNIKLEHLKKNQAGLELRGAIASDIENTFAERKDQFVADDSKRTEEKKRAKEEVGEEVDDNAGDGAGKGLGARAKSKSQGEKEKAVAAKKKKRKVQGWFVSSSLF